MAGALKCLRNDDASFNVAAPGGYFFIAARNVTA